MSLHPGAVTACTLQLLNQEQLRLLGGHGGKGFIFQGLLSALATSSQSLFFEVMIFFF